MKFHHLAKGAIVATGVAAVTAVLSTSPATAQKKPLKEKCYGIVAKGQNDCATASHSCAAQAQSDNDPAEWVYVPAGLCERIAGGTKTPPKAKS